MSERTCSQKSYQRRCPQNRCRKRYPRRYKKKEMPQKSVMQKNIPHNYDANKIDSSKIDAIGEVSILRWKVSWFFTHVIVQVMERGKYIGRKAVLISISERYARVEDTYRLHHNKLRHKTYTHMFHHNTLILALYNKEAA